MARMSKYVEESFKCPAFSDYYNLSRFLINKKGIWKGALLLPTNDPQIECLAKYKEELSKHFIVPIPDYQTVKLFLDKKETYTIAGKAGIQYPFTIYPEYISDVKKHYNKINYPVMIKPRERHKFYNIFGRKLFIANNKKELINKLGICFTGNLNVMITEIIPGPDTNLYSYNFYIDRNRKELAGICQQKLRQAPPNFGVGRVTKTVANQEIVKLSTQLLKYLPGFYGSGNIEFKLDLRDNTYKLMEMNGRPILQNRLFTKAGVNFPYILYQDWVNNESVKTSNYTKELYWINLCDDLCYSLFNQANENYNISEYLKPYIKNSIFALESISDPMPMVYFWVSNIAKIYNFVVNKEYKMNFY